MKKNISNSVSLVNRKHVNRDRARYLMDNVVGATDLHLGHRLIAALVVSDLPAEDAIEASKLIMDEIIREGDFRRKVYSLTLNRSLLDLDKLVAILCMEETEEFKRDPQRIANLLNAPVEEVTAALENLRAEGVL